MTTVATFMATIYMAGDIETAKRTLRARAYRDGMCVTVTPTTFIYTGGEESGFAVRFVNYPKFPAQPEEIHQRAMFVAQELVQRCCQRTALVVSSLCTDWIQVEPPGARKP